MWSLSQFLNFQLSYSTEVSYLSNGTKNFKHQHLLLDEDEEEEEDEFPDASDLESLSPFSSFLSFLESSLSSLSVSAEAAAGTFLRAFAPSDLGQAWTIRNNVFKFNFSWRKTFFTILMRRTITQDVPRNETQSGPSMTYFNSTVSSVIIEIEIAIGISGILSDPIDPP